MSDDQKIELTITANTSGATEGFQKVEGGLKDVEESARSASETFKAVFEGSLLAAGVERAVDIIGEKLGELPELIEKGAKINDITESFDKLAAQAGVAGDALLTKFGAALGDTIPKVDLMKQANELLVGKLDPKDFDLVAQAARSLGKAFGTDAVDGLDKVTQSLLRGNDTFLKRKGIVVDQVKVYEEYAKKVGTTAQFLSEEEKVYANQIAVIQALRDHTADLGVSEIDAGEKIQQIKSRLADQADEALRALANNEGLGKALDALGVAVSKIDLKPLIGWLGDLAAGAANLAAKGINDISAFTAVLKAAGDRADAIRQASAQKGSIFGEMFSDVQAKGDAAFIGSLLKQGISSAFNDVSKSVDGATTAVNAFAGAVAGSQKVLGPHVKSQAELAHDAELAKRALEEQKREQEAYNKVLREYEQIQDKLNQSILQAVTGSVEYQNIIDQERNGTISHAEAVSRLSDEFKKQTGLVEQLVGTQELLNEAMSGNAPSEVVAELTDRIAKLKDQLDGAKDAANQFGKELASALGSGLSGILSGDKNALGGLLGSLGSVFTGKDSSIATSIAGALGLTGEEVSSFLGPLAQSAGEAVGNAVMRGIDHVFGGRDAQGKIRDSLDKLFADALKDNPLQAIINGQLQTITDLNFGKGTDIFKTGAFDDEIQKLSGEAQAAFVGIAQGFTGVFGQGEELATQLAAVLASNLGGSLNNLQLLVESTGKSFDDLKKATVEAFLDGKISALQAQTALNGIANIAQKGIPDAIGAVDTAFSNLQAAGTKGGRALVDALGDIGAESKELGLKTFPQVIAYLEKTGKFSAAAIEQVFADLQSHGITTVDQLTNATADQLLPVLAQLEATKFPFAQATQDAKDYADAVANIPSSKDVTLRFHGVFDSPSTQQAVAVATGGRVSSAGLPQQ